MSKPGLSRKAFFLITFLTFAQSGLVASTKVTQKFGEDTNYFLALRNLEEGKEKDARAKLEKAVKKASPLVAMRSAQTLCTMGNLSQKVSAAKALTKNYTDGENLLIACRIFLEAREYSQIVQVTKNLDFQKDKNELIRIRLEALHHLNDPQAPSKAQAEAFHWFMTCSISEEHKHYLEAHPLTRASLLPLNHQEPTATPKVDSQVDSKIDSKADSQGDSHPIIAQDTLSSQEKLIAFRMDAAAKKYIELFPSISQIEPLLWDYRQDYPLLFSDFCKVIFYGSEEYQKSATLFEELAQKYAGSKGQFYFHFYQGRSWDKLSNYYSRTRSAFKAAMECTTDQTQIDNALWYLWDTGLKYQSKTIMPLIQENCHLIGNPSYFDDFFDNLCVRFLNDGRFEDIGTLYHSLDSHASNETVAKYAYIYARILQEKTPSSQMSHSLWTQDDTTAPAAPLAQTKAAFTRALRSGSSIYYRILAADRLNLSIKDKREVWFAPRTSRQFTPNPHVDVLLAGYIEFGFPQLVYQEYMKHDLVSLQATINAASFLQKCSRGNDDYLVQSLRMASRHAERTNQNINMDLVKLLYPKNYYDKVTECCQKYNVKPASMWALIRSESFFDPDVRSSAGAIGLTQLMEFTAADVAKKLKMTSYDMIDPDTNIEIGCYYLGELIRRLDGDELSAFFSYNAGITRVRRWKQSANTSWKNLPGDIFLETLPYAETREYGRKLTSAQKMYSLY